MEYSNLVSALEAEDTERVNELIKTFYPRLIAYLRIHLNAPMIDAEDCAQETIITSIESIKEGKLEDNTKFVPYTLTICRNLYLSKKRREKVRRKENSSLDYDQHQEPRQLQSLLEEEQQHLLKWCLSQLSKSNQVFMEYWFSHPDAFTPKVAELFNITTANAWTRKHRIIKKLNECYRKKSKL